MNVSISETKGERWRCKIKKIGSHLGGGTRLLRGGTRLLRGRY